MDCLEAILTVTAEKVPLHHSCGALRHEIRRLCRKNWLVVFAYVPRTGNMCADYMAYVGASSCGGCVSWDTPDRRLTMLLLGDAT